MSERAAEVAVVMGSASDWPTVKRTTEVLGELGVSWELAVISAHRSPDRLREFVRRAEGEGVRVIIAAAGGAAHLAGVIAAHTTLPVIGVPMGSGPLGGLDALLSTVQMPAGVPVATVAIGPAGAANAAVLAAQILALANPPLRNRLLVYKQQLARKVQQADEELRKELSTNPPEGQQCP